jgi:hypothetical protein
MWRGGKRGSSRGGVEVLDVLAGRGLREGDGEGEVDSTLLGLVL